MLPIVLALASAVAYGLSDFLAGLAARRVSPVLVAVVATAAAMAITMVVAIVGPAGRIDASALGWGAASGIGSAIGGVALYRGLARGRMAVVAPLSGLGAAVLPIVVGVVLGDRPSPIAWAGLALALPAIWLVSRPADDGPAGPSVTRDGPIDPDVRDGLLAGAGFGLLFIGLDLAGHDAGIWPVVAGEAAAVALLLVVLALTVRDGLLRPDRGELGFAVVAGLLGGLAATAYFLATNEGLLSIVAVLASLYPAVTVVLSAALLHERVGRGQLVGLAAAAVAIALIVVG